MRTLRHTLLLPWSRHATPAPVLWLLHPDGPLEEALPPWKNLFCPGAGVHRIPGRSPRLPGPGRFPTRRRIRRGAEASKIQNSSPWLMFLLLLRSTSEIAKCCCLTVTHPSIGTHTRRACLSVPTTSADGRKLHVRVTRLLGRCHYYYFCT